MEQISPAYITITSYEQSDKGTYPVLSHTFHGRNLEQALSYARSHLLTDFLFSSTFVGSMPWADGQLYLVYKVNGIEGLKHYNSGEQLDCLMRWLEDQGRSINQAQREAGIVQVIRVVDRTSPSSSPAC